MKKKLLVATCCMVISAGVWAETASSGSTSTTTVLKKDSPAQTDKADEIITNRRLRASTGSLSKWSVSSSWSYSAGSIEKPLDAERPNITAGKDVQALQSLTGSIGVRYRLTDTDSMTFSTGLAMATPFHSSIDSDNESTKRQFKENGQKLNVNDPNLNYTKIYKLAGIQNVTALDTTYFTTEFYKNNNIVGMVNLAQQMIYEVGKSGFSFGALVQGNYFYRSSDTKDGQDISMVQPSHGFGVYPMAEYVINDTYNLRTISGVWVYQNTASEDDWTFEKLKIYQSIGLGISVARDVFLYPNIQFLPENIRADATNIGMSANINIF